MNLNQIGLPTLDVPASIAFYRCMGFSPVIETEQYARFKSIQGDATFSLLATHGPVQPGVTVYFEVVGLDAVVSRLKSQGVVFEHDPKTQPWAWKEARLKDPSGNNLCLFEAGASRLFPTV